MPKIRPSAAALVTMAEWADKLDAFLSFNERDVLTHAGRLRMDVAQKLAAERFEAFDANRRATEALAADTDDIAQLEEIEKAAKKGQEGGAKMIEGWKLKPLGDLVRIASGQVDPKDTEIARKLSVGPDNLRSGGGLETTSVRTAGELEQISGRSRSTGMRFLLKDLDQI